MIIDSHLHLPALPQPGGYDGAKRLLLEDMKKDRVDYAILIPDNVPGSPIGDLPTCLELAADVPGLFLMGTLDVQTQGDAWIARLTELAKAKRIVGMKIFPGHDPIYPTDRRLEPAYAMCQALEIPMVVHTGWNSGHPEAAQFNDPKYLLAVAEKFPALKLVIAHLFWPEVDYCADLASGCGRIYFDTSGLADGEVIAATDAERIRGALIRLLENDPTRVIFGSDYAMCDRPAHIGLVRGLPVADAVKENVFWRNAAALFRLPLPNAEGLSRPAGDEG